MSEPRRSTRARAREEAAPPPEPEPPKATPAKASAKSLLKRKRTLPGAKDPTPATPGAETTSQAPTYLLPVRLVEGQSLPTLPEPQPVDLAEKDYQTVQQSGILSASLQRSRATWTSGANFRLFHAFFTAPKKVADRTEEDKQVMQRQKDIIRNFPQLGGTVEAQLIVEPHTFPIRLYGPREVYRAPIKKMPTYGQWPNHNNQYSPYQQYGNGQSAPYSQPSTPQPRPSQPKPPPPPRPQPTKPTTPAPDPVIHMLAQRAGTDPQLKSVMKIVAEGRATKEQLEFFQGHIQELTDILQKQKEAAAKAAKAAVPPQPQPQQQRPPPPVTPQAPAPVPASQPPPALPAQQSTPKPYPPPPSAPSQNQVSSTSYPPTPYNTYNQSQQHHVSPYGSSHQQNQPQNSTYRPLIFDFVEGNGDKFYLPSYSFMEWLPNNQGVKFSFLITKMKPKPKAKEELPRTPAPKSTQSATPVATGPSPAPSNAPLITTTPAAPDTSNATPQGNTPTPLPKAATTPTQPHPIAAAPLPYTPPPRIEDFDEKKDIKDIEVYQPVTVMITTSNFEILQSLPRAIRTRDVVERYMDEVFDKCKRAEETYLAFRLPKEGTADADTDSSRPREGSVATPLVSTPMADVMMNNTNMAQMPEKRKAGRPRKSVI
ncbi:hypothetical protein EJ04DRAFT_509547, partial [Polyplosphaeria fusca]